MKKVAVIVPIYNGEKYIKKTLGNIVSQTIDGLQVILVNDASTDNSLQILHDCRQQYPEIVTVINLHENMGPGGARNAGIEAADAEYIGFADCDDIVDISMFNKLYEKAVEGNYDIVDCGYYNSKEDYAIIHTSDDLTGDMNSDKISRLIVAGGYVWSHLFRDDFIKADKNLRFRKNAILEDADFLTYAFATAKRIGNVKEMLYQYTYDTEAVSQSSVRDPYKYYTNIYNAIEAIYNKTSKLDNYESIKMAVEYEMVQMYLYGAINCAMQAVNPKFNMMEKLNRLKELKNKVITIPYAENEYVKDKIKGDNWKFLQNI